MKHFRLLFFVASIAIVASCTRDEAVKQPNESVKRTTSNIIGEVINSVPYFTANSAEILSKWNRYLADLNPNLTTVTIKINSEGGYILVASGAEYTSSRLLTLDPTNNTLSFTGIVTTCTTKSCSNDHGCEVTLDGRCTKCKGDCTKSTSNAPN